MKKRELNPAEIEIVGIFKRNGGYIPNSNDKKMLGFDLLVGQYFYLNKDNSINKIQYLKDEKTMKILIEEQFLAIDGILMDNVFISSILNNIKGIRIVFNPNTGEFFEEFGDKFFNTFSISNSLLGMRDSLMGMIEREEISKNKDISFLDNLPFTKVLLRNLTNSDENAIAYIINWLSCAINTRKKNMTSIGFVGVEGTGKGVFETIYLKRMFGELLATVSNNELSSNFNSVFDDKMFVVLNEIKADLKESSRTAEILKMLVTDENMNIERKFRDVQSKKTYFNMFLFSNEALPIKISGGDRRWTMISTSSVKLDAVAEALGMSVMDFVDGCEREAYDFWREVFLFDYSIRKAAKTMDTQLKRTIAESTSSKLEVVCKKIINGEFAWLEDRLLEIKEANGDIRVITPGFLEELKDDLSKSRISNASLLIIYNMLINTEMETYTMNKMSFKVAPFLGESKKIGSKRYRTFENNKLDLSYIKQDFEGDETVKAELKE